MRLCYICFQMVFCTMFYNRVFLRCPLVRYGILITVATSIAIWFDSTLHDSFEIAGDDDIDKSHCEPHQTLSEYEYRCLNETTTYYENTEKAAPYIYPLMIEFLLLSVEITVHLFSGSLDLDQFTWLQVQKQDPDQTEDVSDDDLGGYVEGSKQEGSLRHRKRMSGSHDDCQVAAPFSNQATSDNIDDQPVDELENVPCSLKATDIYNVSENNSNSCGLCGCCSCIKCFCLSLLASRRLFVIFFVVLSIGFVMPGFVVGFIIDKDVPHVNILYGANWMFSMIYYVVMILLSILGYYSSSCFQSRFQTYNAYEMTVLKSVFGFYLYIVFSCIAAVAIIANTQSSVEGLNDFRQYMPWMVLIHLALEFVACYLQTSLMLHASRINPYKVQVNDVSSGIVSSIDRTATPQHKQQRDIFFNTVLYLGLANFAVWFRKDFQTLFNAHHDYWFQAQDYYYSKHCWEYIIHILGPFILFFKFNSGIIFMEIFLRRKENH